MPGQQAANKRGKKPLSFEDSVSFSVGQLTATFNLGYSATILLFIEQTVKLK